MATLSNEEWEALQRMRQRATSFRQQVEAEDPHLSNIKEQEALQRLRDRASSRLESFDKVEQEARDLVDFTVDPNIPVDLKSGIRDPEIRAKAAFRPTTDDKFLFLEERFPGKVFKRKGQLFVRQPNADGTGEVDILFDEDKFTGSDFVDMVGQIPEVAAAIGAAFLTKNAGPLKQIFTSNLAGSGIGAAQDTITRKIDDADVNAGETALRRGSELLSGMAIDGVLLGATKLGRNILNTAQAPFGGSAGDLQKNALQSIDELKKDFGVEIEATPGMITGSPAAIRAEVFSQAVAPGGKLAKKNQKIVEDLKNIQDLLTKPDADILEPEQMVRDFTEVFAQERNEILKKVHGINQSLSVELQKDFQQQLREATGKPAIRSLWESGNEIRKAIEAKNGQIRAANSKLYDNAFNAIQQAGGGKIDADKLIESIQKTLKGFPEDTKGRIIDELFPSISNRFRKGAARRGSTQDTETGEIDPAEPITFAEGKKILNQINEQIKFGSPGGGVDQGTLKRLGGLLSNELDKSISSSEFKEARKLLRLADADFKSNVLPFRESGVRELFTKPTERGFVPNENVIFDLLNPKGGITKIRQLKSVLGPDSDQFKTIKRAFMDKVLERSITDTGKISGREALEALNKIDRDLTQELFGKDAIKFLSRMKTLAGLHGKIGGELPMEDVRKLATITSEKEANDLAMAWRAATVAERIKERNYKNKIIGAVIKGDAEEEIIDPKQFVDLFYRQATPRELSQVMNRIEDPRLHESLRISVITDFLQRAQKLKTPQDKILAAKGSDTLISIGEASSQLKKELSKLDKILTQKDIKNIRNLISVEAARQQRDITGGMAGGLAAGETTSDIVAGNIKERKTGLLKAIQYRIISTALASDALGGWSKRTTQLPEVTGNAVLALISTRKGAEMLLRQMQADPQTRGFVYDFVHGLGQELTGRQSEDRQEQGE